MLNILQMRLKSSLGEVVHDLRQKRLKNKTKDFLAGLSVIKKFQNAISRLALNVQITFGFFGFF